MTDATTKLVHIGTGHRAGLHRFTRAVPVLAAFAIAATAGCSSPSDDRPATVTQPWTGVSVTGNALDLAAIVAGTTDAAGTDRSGLSVITPAIAGDRVHASCTENSAAHLDIDDWHIDVGTDTVTVGNTDRGLPASELSTTPIDGADRAVTWHPEGRVDITAAADTPPAWNIAGRIYIGATVTCPS